MQTIQPKDFQYKLILGTTDFILNQSPIGWEENVLNWKRDSKYSGVVRDYSLPLKFVTDGKKILRSQYYQYGIEAFVRLEILGLNRETWQHERIYIGEVDFSKIKDERDFFTANMLDSGIGAKLKAFSSVKYEIPLNTPDAFNIVLPEFDVTSYTLSIIEPGFYRDIYIASSIKVNNLYYNDINVQNTVRGAYNPLNFIAKFEAANISVRIKGYIRGVCSGSVIKFLYDYGAGPVQGYQVYNGSGAIDVSFDFTINSTLGQKVFISTNGSEIKIDEGLIDISYLKQSEEATIKALRPKYLLEQLLKKMNNNQEVLVRSYLLNNTEWKDLVITAGNGIKNSRLSKITTTFNDFVQSYGSILGAGIGIENGTIIFETLDYFYSKGLTIANVGNIKDFNLEPAKDLFYNTISTGYKEQTYNINNGKEEFNNGQKWILPILTKTKELDLVSKYRADAKGIEQIRLSLLKNGITGDVSSDNDVFLLKLKDGSNTLKTGLYYTSINGLVAPNKAYNLDITPKKNLLRNLPFLNSTLDNLNGALIRFLSSDKNAELEVIDSNGKYVKENQNIDVLNFDNQLFKPCYISFSAIYPKNMQQLIEATPYGCIKFSYNGNDFKGFIIEISIDKSKQKAKEFKLLLHPGTDLRLLI